MLRPTFDVNMRAMEGKGFAIFYKCAGSEVRQTVGG